MIKIADEELGSVASDEDLGSLPPPPPPPPPPPASDDKKEKKKQPKKPISGRQGAEKKIKGVKSRQTQTRGGQAQPKSNAKNKKNSPSASIPDPAVRSKKKNMPATRKVSSPVRKSRAQKAIPARKKTPVKKNYGNGITTRPVPKRVALAETYVDSQLAKVAKIPGQKTVGLGNGEQALPLTPGIELFPPPDVTLPSKRLGGQDPVVNPIGGTIRSPSATAPGNLQQLQQAHEERKNVDKKSLEKQFRNEARKINHAIATRIKDIDSKKKRIMCHEVILEKSIEKNLKYSAHDLERIVGSLGKDEDVDSDVRKIEEEIAGYEQFASQKSAVIAPALDLLTMRFRTYKNEILSIRKAIIAKVCFLLDLNKRIASEEMKEKLKRDELDRQKKIDRELAKRSAKRKFFGIFIKDKHTKELHEHISNRKREEQEIRIRQEQEDRKRELEKEDMEILGRESESAELDKAELHEALIRTEKAREAEKEKAIKKPVGIKLLPFGRNKKQSLQEISKKEIDDAVNMIQHPALNPPGQMLKPGQPSSIPQNDVEYIQERIEDAREALIEFDLERARQIYIDVMSLYRNLSDQNKRDIYGEIKDLYEERKNAEHVART